MHKFEKQPREREDVNLDFAGEYLRANDGLFEVELVDIVCLTDPDDVALRVDVPIAFGPTACKLWVSGGTHGCKYKIQVLATTEQGRTVEQEVLVTVKDR